MESCAGAARRRNSKVLEQQRGSLVVAEAMEALGGAGYIEASVMLGCTKRRSSTASGRALAM